MIRKHHGLLMGAGGAGGATIASADCVAYWKFDDFTDSGPNGLTLTAGGSAAASTTAGTFGGGKALVLGANTSDNATRAANALFALNGDFSINCRVAHVSSPTGTVNGILDIGGAISGISLRTNIGSGTQAALYYRNVQLLTVDAGTWTAGVHKEIELVRDAAAQLWYLFVDGNLDYSPTTLTFAGFTSGTPALQFGTVTEGGLLNSTSRTIDDCLITTTKLHTANYTPRTTEYTIV
jgi:hypothetical protein